MPAGHERVHIALPQHIYTERMASFRQVAKGKFVTERVQRFIEAVKPSDLSHAADSSKFNYQVCQMMIHDSTIPAMHDEAALLRSVRASGR